MSVAYIDCSSREISGLRCTGRGVAFRHRLLHVPFNFAANFFALLQNASNNRAEITSCIDAIQRSPTFTPLAIHTDSDLLWDWFHWGRVAHRRGSYRYLENSDLWLRLDCILTKRMLRAKVLMIKVRSHNMNFWNDAVDSLANLGSSTNFLSAKLTSC